MIDKKDHRVEYIMFQRFSNTISWIAFLVLIHFILMVSLAVIIRSFYSDPLTPQYYGYENSDVYRITQSDIHQSKRLRALGAKVGDMIHEDKLLRSTHPLEQFGSNVAKETPELLSERNSLIFILFVYIFNYITTGSPRILPWKIHG